MIDLHDPDTRRIALRAIPLTLGALYFAALVGSIMVRSIRGKRDALVISQIVVKWAMVLWLALMAVNFWGGPTSSELTFDIARGWIGLGALIGLPIAFVYLFRATRDELRYWRRRWQSRRGRENP